VTISTYKFMGALALMAAFAGSALAQTQTFRPIKSYKGVKAIVENTRLQVPQIMVSSGDIKKEHDNEHVPSFGDMEGTNSLPVGEMGDFQRGSVGTRFAGINGTGYFPPDCDFAASLTHAVCVVNLDMAFFNKATGVKSFQTNFATFFASVGIQGNVLSDPKVFYDKISGRFFVTLLETDTTSLAKMLVAVSSSGDPNGNWFKYRIEAKMTSGSNNWWLDYPGFAANKDSVVITGNMFPMGQGGYGGCQFIVMTKAPMLTGQAPTITTFRDPNIGTVMPARTYDATADRIFLASDFSSTQIKLYSLSGLPTTPALDSKFVTVPSWQVPIARARSMGSSGLDSFDGRIFTGFSRGNRLVFAHTVKDSGSNVTMCRWYEFNTANWTTSGPTLTQSGNIRSANNEDFHMPAIGINSLGDISVVYTRSGPNTVADMVVSSRKQTDPVGQMSQPLLLESSTGGAYSAFRWGDYFAVAVDPSDDASFWAFAMVANGTNWRTFWDKYTVSPPGGGGGGGTQVPLTGIGMYQGIYSSGDLSDAQTSDNLYFVVRSASDPSLGEYAAWEGTFTLAQGPANVASMGTTIEARGPTGSTAFVHLYNWSTGQYDVIKSFPLKEQDLTTNITFTGLNFANYINAGTKEVKMVVRAVRPTRTGFMPPKFDFFTDLARLNVEYQ
jgi:hypothetical protein